MKRLLYLIFSFILFYGIASGQAHINLQNGYVVNNGAVVGINNSNSNAIVPINGWIVSESESSVVEWNIGTATGTYVVPFGDSNQLYLPLTLNISAAGAGSGVIKFSTYHTPALNSADKPSDVTNITPFILPGSPSNSDNSYNLADRFYIVDANSGYTTKPTVGNLTLSYISGTASSEVGSPNTLTESHLMAQRFNSTSDTWSDWFGEGCTDAVASNVGTVQTATFSPGDFYRSWSLWDNLTPLPVQISGTSPSCNGLAGSATVTVYGGVSPYTYSWSPSGGNSSTATILSGGTYTATVNDAHGCTSTISITLTQPSAINANATVTSNVTCYGSNNGSALSSPTGGTSPYTYQWSDANTTTTANVSNLPAGSYTVLVNDATGCGATASVTISQPAQFIYVSAGPVNNISCNGGDNGKATVNVVGGNLPYTYVWSNGSSTVSTSQTTPSSLSAGTYTITVTDNCGVSKTGTAIITQPNALRDSAKSTTNISCNGGNSGSIALGCKGGAYPYIFLWSNGTTLQTASGLSAGTYSVVVTDQNGCTNTVTGLTITQPSAINVALASINYPLCNGEKGSASVLASGGVSPYIYAWSPSGGTLATATNLAVGNYTVTVKDAHRCSATLLITMTQPGVIHDSIVKAATIAVACNGGATGSATVGVKYGTSPYTYNWNPNVGSTATVSGLSAGSYTVNIMDKNGCSSSSAVVNITQPANPLQDSVSVKVNPGCFGGASGEISVGTRGGTPPYTYAWSNGKTTYTMSGLSAGTYTTSIVDHHGCSNTISVTITQPSQIIPVLSDSCIGYSTGIVKVSASGGIAPYTYKWSNGKTTTSLSLTNGSYTVTVKDAHGCSETASIIVNCSAAPEIGGRPGQDEPPAPPVCCQTLKDVNLYPNPNTGQFTITGLDQGMLVEIYDYTGRKVSSLTASEISMQLNISDQPNGIYLIRILGKDGTMVAQKKVVKTQ